MTTEQLRVVQERNADKPSDAQTQFQKDLAHVLVVARDLLVEKNRAYGDSALNPVRVFSKASAVEQIKVRMDDKLSRLSRGEEAGEDVYFDLLGYLLIYQIAKLREKEGR